MWDAKQRVIMGSTLGRSVPSGSTIWEYDGAHWQIKSIQSRNGGIAGEPPVIAGRFKGQLRATPCVQPVAELAK